MGYAFNPFTGNFDQITAPGSIPDPLTVNNLTVSTLLTAAHIHGSLAGNVYIHVKNLDVAPLEKGTPFYISGTVGSSDRVEIKRADADGSGTGPAIGLVESTLAVNGEGNGIIIGEIYNYDTATPGWATNDALYVGTTGTLTNVRPTTGYRQIVGHVGRVHASTGTIIVSVSAPEVGTDITYDAATREVRSSTGTDATLPLVSTSTAGLAKETGTPSGRFFRDDGEWAHPQDVIVIPVGDESTALTTGANKVRFRMPFAATLLAVRANVNTAPTGSTLVVDINEAGTSVLGTKLSIDATESSSTTAASSATITDSSLADNAEISVDIDQIGSTVAGAGLKVSLFVRRA
jgi:hypothetical protein